MVKINCWCLVRKYGLSLFGGGLSLYSVLLKSILNNFFHAHESLAGTSQHTRLAPPEIQVEIRFQSGFQALVDMQSHKLAWIKIVHKAVLQPEFRWMPKAFKQAKANWPPISEEEISGHKSEKASLTKCFVVQNM